MDSTSPMEGATQGPAPPARGLGPLARLAPDRHGLDRTFFLLAAGMAALSFSNAAWQSLHAVAWLLLAGLMLRHRRWAVPGPRRWALPWAAFAAWTVVAAALSPVPGEALVSSKKLLNLLAIFLFATVLRSAADYARVLAATCGILGMQCVIAVSQFLRTDDPIAFRPHGTLSHHMTFSGLVLLALSMVLALLTFRRRRGDLLLWGFAALAVVALLSTLTRSAWLALALAATVVLALKNPRLLPVLPAALAVLFLVVPGVRERTRSILDTRGDWSNVQRLSMYPAGLRMVLDNPLFGVGGRRQVTERYPEYESTPPTPPSLPGGPPPEPYEPPDHLHNNLLQVAAMSGIPALLAWLAAMAVFLREAWRALPPRRLVSDERERLRRNLLVGSLAAFAAFHTMGMLEYNFGDSEVSVLFFLVLSVPFALGRRTHPEIPGTGRSGA